MRSPTSTRTGGSEAKAEAAADHGGDRKSRGQTRPLDPNSKTTDGKAHERA